MEALSLFIPLGFVTVIFIIIGFLLLMGQTKESKVHAMKALYVYTVSLISLGSLLIGLGIFLYTNLAHTVFPKAIDSKYSYLVENCERTAYPKPVLAEGETMEYSEEDKQACIENAKVQIAARKEEDYSEGMLNSLIIIFIALPVYLIHFMWARKQL